MVTLGSTKRRTNLSFRISDLRRIKERSHEYEQEK